MTTIAAVVKECVEECVLLAQSHKEGDDIVKMLGLAESAIDAYTEEEMAVKLYRETAALWDKLSKVEATSKEVGQLMYGFVQVFHLKSFSPKTDAHMKTIMTGPLSDDEIKKMYMCLMKIVKTAIMHVHQMRNPVIRANGAKEYTKTYHNDLIKVAPWAKRFKIFDELKFEDLQSRDTTTTVGTNKRQRDDDDQDNKTQ